MVVDAEDQFGNLATGFNGSVAITAPSVVTGTTTATASGGEATFSGLVITQAGTYQLQAGSNNLASVTSNNVTVNPNPQPGQLAWATEPPAQVTHDVGFTVVLDVEDQYGNLETGYNGSVSVALDNNPTGASLGGTTTVTASGGVATFSGLTIHDIASGYTLLATITGVTSPDSAAFDVTPIPAAGLAVTTPPPTSIEVYQQFPLSITVLDAAGVADPDFNGSVTVAIASPLGGNSLTGTTTVNAVAGVANFTDLALTGVGPVTLQVSSGSLSPITTGTINVLPGTATKLAAVTEPPGSVTAGNAFGFEVAAEDQYGNVATGFNGSVTASLSSSNGATLGGTNLTLAVSNGVATFTGLVVTKAGTGYTIQVADSSAGTNHLPTITTTAFNVTPGPLSGLVFQAQPTAPITAGARFGLTVSAADAYGNAVSGFNGPISLSLFNNPAPNPLAATLNGPLTQTATNGVATFSGLSLDVAASGYTIAAAANGLTPGMTGSLTVVPAAASQLVVSVPPPTLMTAGASFGLAIAAEDRFGNLATGFTGNMSIALANNPTGATLSGGSLTMAANGGIVNFGPALTIKTAGSGYTLQATSNGLTPVTTGSITVVPGAATKLVVQTQPPSTVVPGGAFGFVVGATDAYGNVNPNFAGQVTVAPPAGSGATLGGSTTVTAHAGLATFAGLTLGGTGAPVALQVTGTGLAGATTNPVGLTTPAQFAFNIASQSINEDKGTITFEVVRSGGYQGAVSVNVATSGGTAVAGVNYSPINQTLNFAAGQNSQPITISVKNAGILSQSLTVNLVLSNPGTSATLGSPSTATLTIVNAGQSTSNTPVTMEHVQLIANKKHKVQEILLSFSGALNAAEAASISEYALVVAGKHGSFTGKGTKVLKLKSAAYNAANHTVALTLTKPLKLKKPVQLTVNGTPPSGLEDGNNNLIDGNHDGQAGGNAVAVLRGAGATISARTAAVDVLLEQGPLEVVPKSHKK
jgi:hypothetical protein